MTRVPKGVGCLHYALSVWDADKCKKIADVFFKAIQIEPVGFRQYNYNKEKLAILFTDEVFNYLFENLKAEGCGDESSPFQVFNHLCHSQAVDKETLLQFINKAIEIAPAFDRKNPHKLEPITYIKVLTEIFGELRYLGSPVPLVTMTQLFDKVNEASSVSTSSTYNRTVTTVHSLVTDKAGDDSTAEIISQFFINVNFISDGPVVSNAEIERFMKTEQNRDRILDALMILKGQGNALKYDNPFCRMSGDIDIWVDGTRDNINKFVRNRCPDAFEQEHHIEFPIFKDVEVEVHYKPCTLLSGSANRNFLKWCNTIKELSY